MPHTPSNTRLLEAQFTARSVLRPHPRADKCTVAAVNKAMCNPVTITVIDASGHFIDVYLYRFCLQYNTNLNGGGSLCRTFFQLDSAYPS